LLAALLGVLGLAALSVSFAPAVTRMQWTIQRSAVDGTRLAAKPDGETANRETAAEGETAQRETAAGGETANRETAARGETANRETAAGGETAQRETAVNSETANRKTAQRATAVGDPDRDTALGSRARVNVNEADAETLCGLPGIGPVLAARIIQEREQNGPFSYPEDLMAVKGIGQKTLDKLRELICLE